MYRVDRCHLASRRATADRHGDLVMQTRSWRTQVLVERGTGTEGRKMSVLEDATVKDGHEDLVVIG